MLLLPRSCQHTISFQAYFLQTLHTPPNQPFPDQNISSQYHGLLYGYHVALRDPHGRSAL